MLRTAIIDWQVFQYQSWTDEQYVLKEVLIDWCYEFDFKPNDIVLNLWWHIGAFDLFAAPKVNTVITVEPVKESYDKILKHLNINNIPNVMVINKAVDKYNWKAIFWLGINNWHNGLMDNVASNEWVIEVETIAMQQLLQYNPTKIKCDIEWWEYSIFEDLTLPKSVNEMWLETHTFNDKQLVQHLELCENFRQQWFNVEIIDNDTPHNRTYLVHCKR